MNPATIPTFHHRKRRGFTLVELLVAMSVLFGVLLLVTTLVSNVSKTTTISTRSIDSDSVARLFFSRLATDIDSMLIREDIHYGFQKVSGKDDIIAFLGSTKGLAGSPRPVSIISYERFQPGDNGVISLQRGVRSATPNANDWTAPIFAQGTPSLATTADSIVTDVSLAEEDFQSFGPEIIRIEFSFLEKRATGELIARSAPPANIRSLKGIVVAIAVLDAKVVSSLSSANLATLNQTLSDSDISPVVEGDPSSGEAAVDIAAIWQSKLATLSGSLANAAGKTRVYQRLFLFQQ